MGKPTSNFLEKCNARSCTLAKASEQIVPCFRGPVEIERSVEEPVHEQDQVSTTDPDSTYATKGGTPARLGYYDNYLVDNDSCVIVGVQATAARMSQETVAAQDMLTRFAQRQGREPSSIAADATYGNGEFLQWLLDCGITPYMRTPETALYERTTPAMARNDLRTGRRATAIVARPRATELCRPERSQSCPCLYRQRQALWGVLTKSTMHERTI